MKFAGTLSLLLPILFSACSSDSECKNLTSSQCENKSGCRVVEAREINTSSGILSAPIYAGCNKAGSQPLVYFGASNGRYWYFPNGPLPSGWSQISVPLPPEGDFCAPLAEEQCTNNLWCQA